MGTRGSYIVTPAICNVCTIYIFAKLGHATALVLATADDKVYFIENTEIFWNIELLFNVKYRPATKAYWHFEVFL